jgi:hypothetical protein
MKFWRIQKIGLKLVGHTSDDWSGNRFAESGRVCCYDCVDSLLSGEGDDWDQSPGLEVVEFVGRREADLGPHVPGVSAVAVRVLKRTPLSEFLKARRAS